MPLALVSGLALRALLQQQLAQTERGARDLTRALAASIDNELRLTVSALQALAVTDRFDPDTPEELADAHRIAREVLAARPEWRTLLLVRPDGQVVFNANMPLDQPLGAVNEPESVAAMIRSRAPTVGFLAPGRNGNWGIPVRVPVLRGGELRGILSAIIRPEAIRAVIARQRVPDDWTVAVFDGRLNGVARSRDPERFIGKPPSDSLRALVQRMGPERQAYGETATLEGVSVHTAVARMETANWHVALGVPTAGARAALQGSTLAYGSGIVLSVLLGGWLAWLVSRSIERPIARLRESALALGRGEPVRGEPSNVTEIQAMSDALVAAAGHRERAAADREHLLAAERAARTAAEQAQARLQLLVAASSRLSHSLEEDRTLEAIADLIVPSIADACRIDLLDREGRLQRKITHHVDPVRRAAIERFVSSAAAPADTPGTFPWVIRTGESFLATFPAPGEVPIEDPGVREFARIVGIRSAYVVPLVARGQTIGAMAAMQAESGRNLGAEDAALIGELAQRAALALDNVRLFADSRAALRDASIANAAKDEFLAMLGHELRNPLAPIVSALEVMDRSGQGGVKERHVIERQVRHMSRLVDDLLDVSRIASGKVELARRPVDLRDIVHRAVELTHPAFQARVPLALALPAQPVVVEGDATRLTQVVCNLLVNAAKFSPPDSPVTITLASEGPMHRLEVSDEGMGIPPELLPRIFERFVQGDQALNRAAGGLGLGLAIARNLVELHGGRIEAESPGTGQGARFTVRLPALATRADAASSREPGPAPEATGFATGAAPGDVQEHDPRHVAGRVQQRAPGAAPGYAPGTAQRSAPAAAPEAPAAGDGEAFTPIRVLIVDDNIDAAEALAAVLELEGHVAQTVDSGAAALGYLESSDRRLPDVAILDIGLPHMNGYELARALRADPRWSGIHLVALTGYGRGTDQEDALAAGFDVHLVKPADADTVLATLARLMRR